jgi:hypothetical protein
MVARARKPSLRVATEGEKPPIAPKVKGIIQAADNGTRRELLVALRKRIATSVNDSSTPARDLAALSRRLLEIARDIETIDIEAGGDELGNAADIPDDAFDSEAL